MCGRIWAESAALVPLLHEICIRDTGDCGIVMPAWEYDYRKQIDGR